MDLNKELEIFCKYKCPHRKLLIIEDISLYFECPICEQDTQMECREEYNLCQNCPTKEFVKELLDLQELTNIKGRLLNNDK